MDDDWLDITALGDAYEVHFSPRQNRYRYRDLTLTVLKGRGTGAIRFTEPVLDQPWKYSDQHPTVR